MKRRPAAANANAMQIAMDGARKLDEADVQGLLRKLATAHTEFARGQHCTEHWATLADFANLSETMAAMRLGSGPQADDLLERAHRALADVRQRHHQRDTWTLYADEIDALHWLVRLVEVQLRACSKREYAQAYDRTHERLAQALAGNAPAGAIVLTMAPPC